MVKEIYCINLCEEEGGKKKLNRSMAQTASVAQDLKLARHDADQNNKDHRYNKKTRTKNPNTSETGSNQKRPITA